MVTTSGVFWKKLVSYAVIRGCITTSPNYPGWPDRGFIIKSPVATMLFTRLINTARLKRWSILFRTENNRDVVCCIYAILLGDHFAATPTITIEVYTTQRLDPPLSTFIPCVKRKTISSFISSAHFQIAKNTKIASWLCCKLTEISCQFLIITTKLESSAYLNLLAVSSPIQSHINFISSHRS